MEVTGTILLKHCLKPGQINTGSTDKYKVYITGLQRWKSEIILAKYCLKPSQVNTVPTSKRCTSQVSRDGSHRDNFGETLPKAKASKYGSTDKNKVYIRGLQRWKSQR